MEKHRLAKKRNYFKFILTGLPKPVDFEALSEKEQAGWVNLTSIAKSLLADFDNTSREMGLTVHSKCWCGKRMRKNSCGNSECNYVNKPNPSIDEKSE